MITEIESIYGPVYSQQVTYCAETFEEVAPPILEPGWKDTPIGNLVTDAYRLTYGSDIALQAGGSTAQPLYIGPLVQADAFRTVSYGFNTDNGLGYRMATFEMSGYFLKEGLEFGLSESKIHDEFLIQVSGMKYSFAYDTSTSEFIIGEILIDDVPIHSDSLYTVTTNEFVLFFLEYLGIQSLNDSIYSNTSEFQTLAAYIAQFDSIYPLVEGRIENDPTILGIDDKIYFPDEFTLSQNYPNPFNPETTIPFVLSQRIHIVLEVYNILGQKIKTIFSGQMPAGKHKLLWNGRNESGIQVSSGTYIYRLKTGDTYKTRKMILMR